MRSIPTILFLLLATFACLTSCVSVTDEKAVVIFQTTDIHGNIGNASTPGLLHTAYEIRKQRENDGINALWIDCGDLTAGTAFAENNQGLSMIEAFNQAGCDIFVPGNHEFDYGRDILIRNLNAFRGSVLGANLKINGYDNLKPWVLVKRDKYRIAVIGIVTPSLSRITRNADVLLDGIEITSAEDALRRYLPDILDNKPDAIVLAIHVGETTDRRFTGTGEDFSLNALATEFPQINLILCGHSHGTIEGKQLDSGAWLAQAPVQGRDAIRVDLQIKQGKLESVSSKLLGISGKSPMDESLQRLLTQQQQ